jgi:hypothetical protein
MRELDEQTGCVLFYGMALAPYWIIFVETCVWTLWGVFFAVVFSRCSSEPVTGYTTIMNVGFGSLQALFVLATTIFHDVTRSAENSWQQYQLFFAFFIESGSLLILWKMLIWCFTYGAVEGPLEENQPVFVEGVREEMQRSCFSLKFFCKLFPVLLVCGLFIPVFWTHLYVSLFAYFYVLTIPAALVCALYALFVRICANVLTKSSAVSLLIAFLLQVSLEFSGCIFLQTAYHYAVLVYRGENYVDIMTLEFHMRDAECYWLQMQRDLSQCLAFLTFVL